MALEKKYRCFVCMFVHQVCARYPGRPEEGCQIPYGWSYRWLWLLGTGPLEEQPVRLIVELLFSSRMTILTAQWDI